MRLAKSEKAVSTVIATLLMINIAFVTGVMVFAWGQGLMGAFTAQSRVYFLTQGEAIREKILLVNLRYLTSLPYQYQLNITVRNVGYIEARVAEIYLNDTKVLSQVSLAWKNDGTLVSAIAGKYLIPVGDAVTFAFASYPQSPKPNVGSRLGVVAATDRGTRAFEEWGVAG
ncbi:hypothetical protein MUP05_04425 [Candidatus Bathyarchaeota archaeon]|nr:hypothetical protein [Candidatus Bathyarchaeota archaeon]